MCEKHQNETTATATPVSAATPTAVASQTQAAGGCCGTHSVSSTAPAGDGIETAPVATPVADDVAECPVMPGSLVNKSDAEAAGLYRDHDGQRYWLCCAGCGPLWDADPEKYVAA